MATQTEPSELTQSRSTQTEQCDYMFRTPKPWMPEKSTIFEQEFFEGDDGKVRFYTGLPSWEVLMKTFSFVSPHVNRRSLSLSKFQEFVLVLIKLRLAVPHQDLAYLFDVSRTVVSRIIVTWLTVMDVRLSPLISWPSREQLQRTMPKCFIDSLGLKTSVIIDCFEIFIDRPSNLLARAQTFSNYKHHNTAKVLIGITPQGTISFVSEAWGGAHIRQISYRELWLFKKFTSWGSCPCRQRFHCPRAGVVSPGRTERPCIYQGQTTAGSS